MEHGSAKYKIEAAFVHVQTYYCHASLGAKLKIERIGDIEHIDDSFGVHELYSSRILGITKQKIGMADLMVYVNGYSECSNGGCLLGIAGCLGCVCDTEIGDSSVSGMLGSWKVYKSQYWGRHNANWYRGDLLQFAYVRYFLHNTFELNCLLCNVRSSF